LAQIETQAEYIIDCDPSELERLAEKFQNQPVATKPQKQEVKKPDLSSKPAVTFSSGPSLATSQPVASI
jgi:hypothetical protein